MADSIENGSNRGSWLITAVALAGLAVSVINFFNPASGIAREPGTILVIASTLILVFFGLFMAREHRYGAFLRTFIALSALLNIAGTGFAAYLLHSQSLAIFMLAALLGWIIHIFGPRRTAA